MNRRTEVETTTILTTPTNKPSTEMKPGNSTTGSQSTINTTTETKIDSPTQTGDNI